VKNPSIFCLIANGFEEMEAVVPVDLLRRAGSTVVLATVGEELDVRGHNGITVKADVSLLGVSPALSEEGKPHFDALVIPGGRNGVEKLREDGRAKKIAAAYEQWGAWVAAICAGPLILADAGLLSHRQYTAHSSISMEMPHILISKRVVVERKVVTSSSAGAALDFGLTLVELLMGEEKMQGVRRSILG